MITADPITLWNQSHSMRLGTAFSMLFVLVYLNGSSMTGHSEQIYELLSHETVYM